ncbi:PERI protein, partial [Climacteris rufus]|nr:PERI protein [Climacteris rufus]
RLEDETQKREDAEKSLVLFRKDVDHATLSRLELERKVELLMDEIGFLKKLHEEELRDLEGSAPSPAGLAEAEVCKPELTAALREIRTQYESIAVKNLQEAEEWYKSKVHGALGGVLGGLSRPAAPICLALAVCRPLGRCQPQPRGAAAGQAGDERVPAADPEPDLRGGRAEGRGESRGTPGVGREVTPARPEQPLLRPSPSQNEALQRQMREMEDEFGEEIGNYQDVVGRLEQEIQQMKEEMSRHLREYQDLLNVKMALDIEITTYRKLLEGEESR